LQRTLYQAGTWPLAYHDDPVDGWGLVQVLRTSCGNATNDLIGKLYCHIRSQVWGFHQYLSRKDTKFEFFNMDATKLPAFLPKSAFARIEVKCIQLKVAKTTADVLVL
jgi:hypothetical protein